MYVDNGIVIATVLDAIYCYLCVHVCVCVSVCVLFRYPFTPDQPISECDWEVYLRETASMIVEEQTPKRYTGTAITHPEPLLEEEANTVILF